MGIKWEALDRQLSVDAAIYQIEKRNVLTTDPVDSTFSVAAGEVRSRGFDLNVAGNLTPQWRVIGGYAYVDAEVTKDNVIDSGTRLMNIPQQQLQPAQRLRVPGRRAQGAGPGHRGSSTSTSAPGRPPTRRSRWTATPSSTCSSYYKVNDKVRLNLDVKNLFDRDYEEGAFGNVYAYPGAPRTVQVGISYTL